jgi:hypothetical protein
MNLATLSREELQEKCLSLNELATQYQQKVESLEHRLSLLAAQKFQKKSERFNHSGQAVLPFLDESGDKIADEVFEEKLSDTIEIPKYKRKKKVSAPRTTV